MLYKIRIKEIFGDTDEIVMISHFTVEAKNNNEAHNKALDYCNELFNSHFPHYTEWEVDDLEFISTYGFPTDETPR